MTKYDNTNSGVLFGRTPSTWEGNISPTCVHCGAVHEEAPLIAIKKKTKKGSILSLGDADVGEDPLAIGFEYEIDGILFTNTRSKSANSPTHSGHFGLKCECGQKTEFWLAAWYKPTKKDPNSYFFSLALDVKAEQVVEEPKEDQPESNYGKQAAPPNLDDCDDDDIPF